MDETRQEATPVRAVQGLVGQLVVLVIGNAFGNHVGLRRVTLRSRIYPVSVSARRWNRNGPPQCLRKAGRAARPCRAGTGPGSGVVARTYPTQHFDAQDAYFDPRISSRASSARSSSWVVSIAVLSDMAASLLVRMSPSQARPGTGGPKLGTSAAVGLRQSHGSPSQRLPEQIRAVPMRCQPAWMGDRTGRSAGSTEVVRPFRSRRRRTGIRKRWILPLPCGPELRRNGRRPERCR